MAPPNPAISYDSSTPNEMRGIIDPDLIFSWLPLVGPTNINDCLLVKFRISTGVYETILCSTIQSNVMHMPLTVVFPDTDAAHWTLCVGAASNAAGTRDEPHYMGNHHDNGSDETVMHYIKCTNVNAWTNPASWAIGDTSAWSGMDSSSDEGTYTYHHFDRDTNGDLILFQSQSRTGGATPSSKGRRFLFHKCIAGVWSKAGLVVGSGGGWDSSGNLGYIAVSDTGNGYLGTPIYANRAYISSFIIEPTWSAHPGRWHIFGIWRTNDSVTSSQQAPFYLYSDNRGNNWKRLDGTDQVMPIHWGAGGGSNDNRGTATISGAPANCELQWGCRVDAATGAPGCIIKDFSNNHYHRFDGISGSWVDTDLTSAGVTLNGVPSLVDIHNVGSFYRHVSSGRSALKIVGTTTQLFVGGPIRTASVEAAFTHDPASLREYGEYWSMIGTHDTPQLWRIASTGARRFKV